VVGLTNRPELLDPALLRPGRLEVQLRIELPDQLGRRDILRIHTRKMNEAGGISQEALKWIDNAGDTGLASHTEHFSGAELAGLVRSAASFALARTLDGEDPEDEEGIVSVADLKQALREVRPALGKQDEMLKARFPLGISPYSSSVKRILRDLERFTSPPTTKTPRLQSLLLVGAGGNGGAGATALAAWAASQASTEGKADYVRFITALDLLVGGGDSGEEARAAALVERFAEAREMPHSLLVLDDVDQLCAGRGPGGYSSILLATLRALLRSPPSSSSTAKAGGQTESRMSAQGGGKTIHILASTSRSDAACATLHELFDETIGTKEYTYAMHLHFPTCLFILRLLTLWNLCTHTKQSSRSCKNQARCKCYCTTAWAIQLQMSNPWPI
jgi:vesicle-fusing ATPase